MNAAARSSSTLGPSPAPAGWSLERVALVVGLALNLAAGAAAFATVKADIANLRAEIPPGAIQRQEARLDEMSKALDRLADAAAP